MLHTQPTNAQTDSRVHAASSQPSICFPKAQPSICFPKSQPSICFPKAMASVQRPSMSLALEDLTQCLA
jgi:hypothetical protein